jgi:hypothetical protein
MLAILLAAVAVAAQPNLDKLPTRAWSAVVEAGQVRTIPAAVCSGKRPSDVHGFTLKGRPLRQSRDGWGNIAFLGRSGHVVVGYVPVNRDWFGFRGRVRVAAWCG